MQTKIERLDPNFWGVLPWSIFCWLAGESLQFPRMTQRWSFCFMVLYLANAIETGWVPIQGPVSQGVSTHVAFTSLGNSPSSAKGHQLPEACGVEGGRVLCFLQSWLNCKDWSKTGFWVLDQSTLLQSQLKIRPKWKNNQSHVWVDPCSEMTN